MINLSDSSAAPPSPHVDSALRAALQSTGTHVTQDAAGKLERQAWEGGRVSWSRSLSEPEAPMLAHPDPLPSEGHSVQVAVWALTPALPGPLCCSLEEASVTQAVGKVSSRRGGSLVGNKWDPLELPGEGACKSSLAPGTVLLVIQEWGCGL